MSDSYDVIVIGSGLGGLTAGARLTREGRKVLVLEKHFIPGGYASTFRRKGFTFEVGLQELDGLESHDIKRRIFSELGLDGKLDFVQLPGSYKAWIGKNQIDVPEIAAEAIEVLSADYPDDRRGLKRFYRVIHGLRDELMRLPQRRARLLALLPVFPFVFPRITRYLFMSLGGFLDRSIRNPVLKVLLMANLFYFDDDPYNLGLIYFAAGQGGFSRGSHYIKGGSGVLSGKLADVISRGGGRVECSAEVSRIDETSGRLSGVIYTSEGVEKRAEAPVVICNASPHASVTQLLPEIPGVSKLRRQVGRYQPSMSFTQISMTFNSQLSDLGIQHYKTLLLEENAGSLKDFRRLIESDFQIRPLLLNDYGQIDSGLADRDESFAVVLIPDRISNWENLDGQEYRKRKKEVFNIVLKRLERICPGISDALVYHEVATPRTMKRYTGNPEGAVYGYAQNPLQAGLFRLPVKSPVKGLFFAGAWTYPGGGFTGTLWSGWSCAYEIMGREPDIKGR